MEGSLSGENCDIEGSTTCSSDPDSDPLFYVCRRGKLAVFDHENFRGGALCQRTENGGAVVVYGDGMDAD
jgi:hypothetical protein